MLGYWEGRGESVTLKLLRKFSTSLINPFIINIFNLLYAWEIENIKAFTTLEHSDFGDSETFQIESKTMVGMIPTKFKYCSINLPS